MFADQQTDGGFNIAQLAGKKIAILATGGFEQPEPETLLGKLRDEGAIVDGVSPKQAGSRQAAGRLGTPVPLDRRSEEVCGAAASGVL
jgi:hypothetical protein